MPQSSRKANSPNCHDAAGPAVVPTRGKSTTETGCALADGGRDAPRDLSRGAFIVVVALTICTMLPVTGVVPVLKGLVAERFGVGDFLLSTFMSLNMVGALLGAPLSGWLSDRHGWTKRLLVAAAGGDALLWWAMSLAPTFQSLMCLRFVEGALHIAVLSMLLTVVSRTSSRRGRRSRVAALGGGIIFGVAIGAPLGGILGRHGATVPLQAGALVMALVALCAWIVVPRSRFEPDPNAQPSWPKLHVPPALRLPYLFGFVDRFSVGFFVVSFPLFTARHLQLDPAQTGKLIGAFMMPFALLSYAAGRWGERCGLWRFVLGGSLCYGVAFAAIPWLAPGRLVGGMMVCGVLSAIMFGPNLVLVVAASSTATRSSSMAGFNTVGSLGFLLGPLAAGIVLETTATWWGSLAAHRITFAMGGLTEVACVACAVWLLHGRARQGGRTAAEAGGGGAPADGMFREAIGIATPTPAAR